jgi:hypothetical protein
MRVSWVQPMQALGRQLKKFPTQAGLGCAHATTNATAMGSQGSRFTSLSSITTDSGAGGVDAGRLLFAEFRLRWGGCRRRFFGENLCKGSSARVASHLGISAACRPPFRWPCGEGRCNGCVDSAETWSRFAPRSGLHLAPPGLSASGFSIRVFQQTISARLDAGPQPVSVADHVVRRAVDKSRADLAGVVQESSCTHEGSSQ